MVLERADRAFGNQYVWAPGAPGARGGGVGSVTCKVTVAEAGTYYLWARVLTPTPDDDSFFVRLYAAAGEVCPRRTWHAGVHPEWEWVPVLLEDMPGSPASALTLPVGEVMLELSVRENGAGLDRFFLSGELQLRP